MMPFPTWEEALQILEPYGIKLVCFKRRLTGSNGLEGTSCVLKREDLHCRRSLAVDITAEQAATERLLPSQMKAICRRFQITDDPFGLEMD